MSHIRIPIPVDIPTRKGLRAVSKGVPTSVRIHPTDLQLVHQEAAELGIDSAKFIRWAALFLALELYKARTGEDIEVHP